MLLSLTKLHHRLHHQLQSRSQRTMVRVALARTRKRRKKKRETMIKRSCFRLFNVLKYYEILIRNREAGVSFCIVG